MILFAAMLYKTSKKWYSKYVANISRRCYIFQKIAAILLPENNVYSKAEHEFIGWLHRRSHDTYQLWGYLYVI